MTLENMGMDHGMGFIPDANTEKQEQISDEELIKTALEKLSFIDPSNQDLKNAKDLSGDNLIGFAETLIGNTGLTHSIPEARQDSHITPNPEDDQFSDTYEMRDEKRDSALDDIKNALFRIRSKKAFE